MEIPSEIEKLHTLAPSPMTKRGDFSFLDVSGSHLVYFNGPCLIIKQINSASVLHFVHQSDVRAAKLSSNGKLVASVDEKGTLYIHEIGPQKLFEVKKYDNFYLGAKALDWTPDNKKLCVVGSAKNCYGKVISVDTGTSVGEVTGVSANLTCCAFTPNPPFTLAVGGDQFMVKFYKGPPFKFLKSTKTHSTYINCLKFNPSGKILVSTGSDKKIVLYDRESLEVIKEKSNCHTGSIYGLDWIDDSKFLTASADKSLKIWNLDIEEICCIHTCDQNERKNFKMVDNFQVAVKHHGGVVFTVSLNGEIRSFKVPPQLESGMVVQLKNLDCQIQVSGCMDKPKKVITINEQNKFIVLDSNSKVLLYEVIGSKECKVYLLNRNEARNIQDGCWTPDQKLWVLWTDGSASKMELKVHEGQYSVQQRCLISDTNAKFICASKLEDSKYEVILASNSAISCYSDDKLIVKTNINEDVCCLSSHNRIVCLGTIKGNCLIFQKQQLKQITSINASHTKLTCIHIRNSDQSNCELTLIAGDALGKLKTLHINIETGEVNQLPQSLGNHESLITGILSLQNGSKDLLTTAMEGKLNRWSEIQPGQFKRVKDLKNLHQFGVTSASIVGKSFLITTGGDHLVKVWELKGQQ